MNTKETVSVLNDLIATSENGKKGFAEAEQCAVEPDLKAEFHKRSEECDQAATELQTLVRSLGGTPETHGTVAGAAHRGWIMFKAKISDNDIAVLEEVERGEDHAKAAYSKALKSDLPSAIRPVVQRQHDGAVKNHDRIRDLRNAYRAGHSA